MSLPAGRARQFKQDMLNLVALPQDRSAARVSRPTTYQRAASHITRELDEARAAAFEQFDQQARAHGFTLARSDQGLVRRPDRIRHGEPATAKRSPRCPTSSAPRWNRLSLSLEDRFNAMLRTRPHRSNGRAARNCANSIGRRRPRTIEPRLNTLIEQYRADVRRSGRLSGRSARRYRSRRSIEFARWHADRAAEATPDAGPAPDPLLRFQVNVLVDHSRDARRADRRAKPIRRL